MNREIPVANRVIHKKQLQRSTDFHLNKINSMKFSNLSALKNKSEARSANKVKNADIAKLLPIETRNRRVKTVMNDQRIREENKHMYSRLVNQKPTLSSKLFAEDRHKNIQFLKRIGRYPYRPNSTLMLEPLQEQDNQYGEYYAFERSNTQGELEEISEMGSDLKISLNSMESIKHYNINSKIQQQQRKQYTILLWSKVIQLQKNWHTVKFQRFKNHYQIEVSPYPDHKVEYSIRLAEEVGTAMLSENDYDYEFIANKFIKFTHQTLCLSFELKDEKKKHFYKFVKKSPNNAGSSLASPTAQPTSNQSPPIRKTVFALQNEENESKQPQQGRARVHTQEVQTSNHQSTFHDMNKEDIIIQLSRR